MMFALLTQAEAGSISDPARLQAQLQALTDKHPGRVGICVEDASLKPICVNGDQRFSLQSVMKVVVGVAVMRAVDDGRLKLDDPIVIQREDLSVNIQPIADIVAEQGSFETTIGDLVARAVIESDSAATDVLILELGGAKAVQSLLDGAGIKGIRIDRTERELQTETTGLRWQTDYVYPDRLEEARKRVSDADKKAAFAAYLKDERDTTTPRGMTAFLSALATGELLSPASTRNFLNVMARTKTFPDRLRAGTPKTWTVAHKTGTSQTLDGVNGVTNDVGILTAPDGGKIAISVFVAESTASNDLRAAVIANAARATVAAYR
ncbi:class A beta-lactamase [Nitratireductor soli]|uniref:class A beta-lactamase n=1 Tax=Nitratireductor soli TaxID=1670619 RepID=UPI00065E998B|nr:class A beta-lactamase [Nitratireductor soli]